MTICIAIVRGAALNKWEMQSYEPLQSAFDVFCIGQRDGLYDVSDIQLPVVELHSLISIATKSSFLGRVGLRLLRRVDTGKLLGLEKAMRPANIVHAAETFIPFSEQAIKAKKQSGAKVVLTCWENIPFLHDEDSRLAARKRAVRAGVDRFLAITPMAKRALMLEGVEEQMIRLIPAGVNQKHFRPQPKDRSLLAQWGLPSDSQVILYCGRFIQEKGLADLIHAARLLYGMGYYENVRFVLVGSGPERLKLETMVKQWGITEKVIFAPNQTYKRMPAVHALADIFVLPSVTTPYWQEQFGMVLAEAMACGKAIITTRSGSIPDVVGEAALLVDPYAPEQLAGALAELLNNTSRRAYLGFKASERAAELYDADIVAAQIKEIYEELLISN